MRRFGPAAPPSYRTPHAARGPQHDQRLRREHLPRPHLTGDVLDAWSADELGFHHRNMLVDAAVWGSKQAAAASGTTAQDLLDTAAGGVVSRAT